MKIEILNFLDMLLHQEINNTIQKNKILNLYRKLKSNNISSSDACDLVDVISEYMKFDIDGNPIEKTETIEDMIDWILEKYNLKEEKR